MERPSEGLDFIPWMTCGFGLFASRATCLCLSLPVLVSLALGVSRK
jgi:hypothetical protein